MPKIIILISWNSLINHNPREYVMYYWKLNTKHTYIYLSFCCSRVYRVFCFVLTLQASLVDDVILDVSEIWTVCTDLLFPCLIHFNVCTLQIYQCMHYKNDIISKWNPNCFCPKNVKYNPEYKWDKFPIFQCHVHSSRSSGQTINSEINLIHNIKNKWGRLELSCRCWPLLTTRQKAEADVWPLKQGDIALQLQYISFVTGNKKNHTINQTQTSRLVQKRQKISIFQDVELWTR